MNKLLTAPEVQRAAAPAGQGRAVLKPQRNDRREVAARVKQGA